MKIDIYGKMNKIASIESNTIIHIENNFTRHDYTLKNLDEFHNQLLVSTP